MKNNDQHKCGSECLSDDSVG